jgi:hypothetical protein
VGGALLLGSGRHADSSTHWGARCRSGNLLKSAANITHHVVDCTPATEVLSHPGARRPSVLRAQWHVASPIPVKHGKGTHIINAAASRS